MTKEIAYLRQLALESSNGELLKFALILGVPNAMRDLRLLGGPLDHDWEQARAFSDTLAEQGADLLFKSKKKGETAALCTKLIRMLAVMAFVPGGVDVFGLHFDAGTPDAGGAICCNTLEGSHV